MSIVHENDVQQHVSIVGWLLIIGNVLVLAIGAFVFTLLTGLGLTVNDPQARAILPLVGSTVGLLLVFLSVPGFLAGYGVLTRKAWGRILAMVVSVLGLLNFPIGTAIGLYTLWVLLQTSTANYFATTPETPLHLRQDKAEERAA